MLQELLAVGSQKQNVGGVVFAARTVRTTGKSLLVLGFHSLGKNEVFEAASSKVAKLERRVWQTG